MSAYFSRRLFIILALGFSSGLPLALTASTLGIWLTESGVSKTSIGLFAAVALPYSLKFLWAPVVDALPFPVLTRVLGRRRGWLLGTQCLLVASVLGLGAASPAINPWLTALAALAVAFCSATQDIVIDAFRVESLPAEDQARGAAMATLGYRLSMLASGAGALYLAEYAGWQITYGCMAALIGLGISAALLAPEPAGQGRQMPARYASAQEFFTQVVLNPLRDFAQHSGWVAILCFVLLFKFGDAFLGVMTSPFLVEIGFTKPQIAEISKIYGLVASITGGFAGAWVVARLGLMRSLWVCGVLNGVSNLGFMWLFSTGPSMPVYAVVNSVENFTGGMGGAVMVAYLSSLCNVRYTATQYALLSSLASVARTLLSTPAGAVVEQVGWQVFFALSAALTVPGLIALAVVQRGRKRP